MTTAQKSAVCREREGWGASSMICLFVSMRDFFFEHGFPEQKYQKISFFWEGFMIASVKFSHPFPACDMGWPARTVSVVLRRGRPVLPSEWGLSFRSLDTEISLNFLKYIYEWWWISDSFHDRKKRAHELVLDRDRVLPENNYFDVSNGVLSRAEKKIFWMRVNRLTCKNLVFYKTWKSLKIWFSNSSLRASFQLCSNQFQSFLFFIELVSILIDVSMYHSGCF